MFDCVVPGTVCLEGAVGSAFVRGIVYGNNRESIRVFFRESQDRARQDRWSESFLNLYDDYKYQSKYNIACASCLLTCIQIGFDKFMIFSKIFLFCFYISSCCVSLFLNLFLYWSGQV